MRIVFKKHLAIHYIMCFGIILLSIQFMGCSEHAQKDKLPPSHQNRTQEKAQMPFVKTEKLSIGVTPLNQEAIWLQENKKKLPSFDAGKPVSPEISWVVYTSQEGLLQGLINEEVNAAYLDPVMAMRGYSLSKGTISVVAGASHSRMALIGLKETPEMFLDELKDKVIGVIELKSTEEVVLKKMLKEAGLQPSQYQVKTFEEPVPLTTADVEALLEKGEYAAIMVSEPLLSLLKDSKKTRVLLEPEALFPDSVVPSLSCIVQSQMIEENPETVSSWMQLHLETTKYLKSQKDRYHQLDFDPMSGALIKLTYWSLEFQAIKEEPMADQFYKLELLRDVLRKGQLKTSPAP